MKKALFITIVFIFAGLFSNSAFAHPASGIVVDKQGNVYFIYSRTGVVKISVGGKLTYIHKATDGHWMCLDETGAFANTRPVYFERITPDGVRPALIFAGGGSPVVVNKDGNFYYCGGENGDLHPGALTLVRETPQKQQTIFAPELE
jgi:hypothetical protein